MYKRQTAVKILIVNVFVKFANKIGKCKKRGRILNRRTRNRGMSNVEGLGACIQAFNGLFSELPVKSSAKMLRPLH